MLTMKALMQFLDRGFVIRALFVTMLLSLILIGEYFLVLSLKTYFPSNLILSGVSATALIGVLIAVRPLTRALDSVQTSIDAGYYPEEPFARFAGTLVAAFLLVTPGLATDAIGLMLFVPILRRLVGSLITRRMHQRLNELYEYLKLYER